MAELVFRSELRAPAAAVWAWIVSVEGIGREMWPVLRMTTPRGVGSIAELEVRPGERLFRSRLLLLGVLPIGRSDLTLVELVPGEGFVEESPMTAMKRWRHERRIAPGAGGGGSVLTDRLTFEPRWAKGIVAWCIGRFFRHRHAVLRRHLGGER